MVKYIKKSLIMLPEKPPKIFVIGHHKIATRSIDRLFRWDGYPTMHCRKGKIARTMLTNLRLFRPLLHGLEDIQVFSDMEYVSSDGELFFGYRLFPQLDYHYPGSYFIYNYRKVDDWIKSQFTHRNKALGSYTRRYKKALKKLLNVNSISDQQLEQHYLDCWSQHEKDVNRYFSDRNNLIRLDITNADSKSEFIDAIRKLNYQISRDDLPYVGKTKKKATSTSTNSNQQQP